MSLGKLSHCLQKEKSRQNIEHQSLKLRKGKQFLGMNTTKAKLQQGVKMSNLEFKKRTKTTPPPEQHMALGLSLSWFLKLSVEFRYVDSLKSYTSFVTIIIGVKKTIMRKRKLTNGR